MKLPPRSTILLTFNFLPANRYFCYRNVKVLSEMQQVDIECPEKQKLNIALGLHQYILLHINGWNCLLPADFSSQLCSPSFDVHIMEENSGCLSGEEFEPALSVLDPLDTQEPYQEVEAIHQECAEYGTLRQRKRQK